MVPAHSLPEILMSIQQAPAGPAAIGWRTPIVVVICGCLIAMIAFGPRSSLGFFLTPMSQEQHWGRDVFSIALAIQNLLWGIGQPFAGGIADRFGATRVMIFGAVCYAAGLALMAHATTPGMLNISAGVLIGLGLSGCSFNLVIGAFGKLLPDSWRSLAFGAGTAAGSFGQFLYSPIGVALMDKYGWQTAITIFAGVTMLILPLAMALATPKTPAGQTVAAKPTQSARQAFAEAFGHRSYVLLVLGFFTCGFQLAFVTVHLPSYLIDRGLSAQIGGWKSGHDRAVQHHRLVDVRLSREPHAKALHPLDHLFCAGALNRRVHFAAGQSGRDAGFRRSHRAAVALDGAANVCTGRRDVRHPLACHAVRVRVLQPPGRRLPRRLAGGLRVRHLRVIQSGVVAFGVFRRDVRAHQLAHRGKADCASRDGACLRRLHEPPARAKNAWVNRRGARGGVQGNRRREDG